MLSHRVRENPAPSKALLAKIPLAQRMTTHELGTSPPLTQGLLGPLARNAEKVSKLSPSASGLGTPKKSPKSLEGRCGKSPESV